jgi:hypothetical protein
MYWAGEGYLGPINMPFTMRFAGPVDEAQVRLALRELTTAFPRLRGVVEPSAFSYHLRILPDDHQVDQLFADVYRVQHGIDTTSREALAAFHTDFINEPISLERGLPWRGRFLPHPTQPVLVFSVHHLIGDGRSMVALMCAILGRLNGQPIQAVPLDNPSMAPAVNPLKWSQWPGSIARWWRQTQADKRAAQGQRVITLNKGHSPRYTTSTVRYHELPCPADTMKALAKQHDTTVNTLLMAMVANAFLALAPGDDQAVAAIRLSVDLRRYFPEGEAPEFGNYVSSFTLRARHQPTLAAQIASLEAQVKDHMARYERRDLALPLSFYEWLPLLGRNLYGHLIVRSKLKKKFPPLSCHLSSLGNVEFIHPKGATVRLEELWPATLSTALLLAALSLNGKQFIPLCHQNDEVSSADVSAFLKALDEQVHNLQSAAATPAAA